MGYACPSPPHQIDAEYPIVPNPAHQQAIIIPQEVFGDVDVLVTEVLQFGPVLVVVGHVSYLYLVNESMLPLVLEHRLCLVGFIRAHEVRRQSVVDHFQSSIDGHRKAKRRSGPVWEFLGGKRVRTAGAISAHSGPG